MYEKLTPPVQQIPAVNIPRAYATGHSLIRQRGILENTRNGPALVLPGPTITSITQPWERVLFDEMRDANPFFHLMEAMWMLAGRRDVETIAEFNKRMVEYSDDGEIYHAAYGQRWREWFGMDQLSKIIHGLRTNPEDRRLVLTMWSPLGDLAHDGKDVPCNTQAMFRTRRETVRKESIVHPGMMIDEEQIYLDMTVCNRSNDFFWGLMGANAVHMSIMHEYVAALSGMHQGHMYTLSNNLHAYTSVFNDKPRVDLIQAMSYNHMKIAPHPLFRIMGQSTPSYASLMSDQFKVQLNEWWCGERDITSIGEFTDEGALTVGLMRASYRAWKRGDRDLALDTAIQVPAVDWSRAAVEWIERRTR